MVFGFLVRFDREGKILFGRIREEEFCFNEKLSGFA